MGWDLPVLRPRRDVVAQPLEAGRLVLRPAGGLPLGELCALRRPQLAPTPGRSRGGGMGMTPGTGSDRVVDTKSTIPQSTFFEREVWKGGDSAVYPIGMRRGAPHPRRRRVGRASRVRTRSRSPWAHGIGVSSHPPGKGGGFGKLPTPRGGAN